MLVCFCCSAPLVWAQQDKPPVEIIAVVGAELRICENQGTIPNGVVLFQGDTILAVGDSTLVIPAGAQTIDAKGCVVTPGQGKQRRNIVSPDESQRSSTDGEGFEPTVAFRLLRFSRPVH